MIKQIVAFLSAFIMCQLSYLFVMIGTKMHGSDLPGEQLTLILLSATSTVDNRIGNSGGSLSSAATESGLLTGIIGAVHAR